MSDLAQRLRRGSGDGMHAQGDRAQHGKPRAAVACDHQRTAREGLSPAGRGGGEVRSTVEAGQCRWREGTSVQGQRRKWCRTQEIGVGLATPQTVQKLQAALHAKAKGSPNFRFYSLYDKLFRADVLAHAYAACKANQGVAGVDGQTFADIESYGLDRWLGELAEELRNKTYRPQAVRRVYIPKANGKQRPLGIPTIRDRVAQMACVRVLDPIFEADMQPEQYAYRSGRSALDAVQQVHALLNSGHTEVVEGDLSGYFDTIPHAELMRSLSNRRGSRGNPRRGPCPGSTCRCSGPPSSRPHPGPAGTTAAR